MKKSPITTLCLFLLGAALLNSCGAESGTPTLTSENGSTATEAVTEPREYPEIPENLNYNNYEFRIIGYLGGYTTTNDYIAEEAIGEVINDAVYDRNLAVSEKLGVTFSAEITDDVLPVIRRAVTADEYAYDLAFTKGNQLGTSIQSGCYINLIGETPLELDKPWYDANSVASLTIGDKLYAVNCDISTQHNNETSIIYYNKTFAADLDLPDLYQLAFNGKWTIDVMQEYAKIAADDTNGDSAMTADDTFGITGNSGMAYIFYIGEGGRYMEAEGNDIVVPFADERNISRMMDVITRFTDPSYVLNEHVSSYNTSSWATFMNARSLFFVYALGSVHVMRNTDVEYGLLPIPKENEEQERYYNNVNFTGNAYMSIPKTVSDIDRTALITDVLCAESYYTLRPAYYEIAVKDKYIRDEPSVKMLDMIFANRVYDIGILYEIGGLVNTLCGQFTERNTSVESTYTSLEKGIDHSIEKFLEAIENTAE